MPAYRGHSGNCEKAGAAKCVCRCAGVYHGWPGTLAIARNEPWAIARGADWRSAIEREYAKERGKPSNTRAGAVRTKPYQHSVVELARIEITTNIRSIIRQEDGELQQGGMSGADGVLAGIEQLGDVLYEDVLPEIQKRDLHTHRTEQHSLHKILADHAWCELIARIAGWLANAQGWVQQVPGEIVALVEQFWTKTHGRLSRWLVRIAVRGAWQGVANISAIGGLGLAGPLWVTRVMALAMCKEPNRHETVLRNCLAPLKHTLTGLARDRLVDALPVWLADHQVEPAPAAVR